MTSPTSHRWTIFARRRAGKNRIISGSYASPAEAVRAARQLLDVGLTPTRLLGPQGQSIDGADMARVVLPVDRDLAGAPR